MKPLGTHSSFSDLASDVGILVRPDRLAKWRLLFPNAGELDGLPHLGTVLILCTDGTEAYFHVGRDTIFHGHLKNFNGPVAYEYVFEQDWDYVRRVPRGDSGHWNGYWQTHPRLSPEEHHVYASALTVRDNKLFRGMLPFADIDKELEKVRKVILKTSSHRTAREILATL